MRVSIIAEKLDYELIGGDREITGIAYYNEAKKDDIAIVKSKREIEMTESNIILTKPILTPTKKTLLVTYDDFGMAMDKVCTLLEEEGILTSCNMPSEFKHHARGYCIANNCTVGNNTTIFPGVIIGNDVKIGANCIIEPNVVIGSNTIIERNVVIGSGSKIGADSFFHYYDYSGELCPFNGIGKVIIKSGTKIGSNCVVQRGTISDTVIGETCMIGNCIDIGHDVKIGNNCKIVSQTGIAGNAILKNNVLVYGQVGIANDVIIGNNAVIKAKTIVSKSVNDNQVVFGLFGRNYYEEIKIVAKIRKVFGRKDD